MKMMNAKILLQEKQYYEKKMQEEPDKEQFWKNKVDRVEYEQWVLGKLKREPPRYTLLV